MMQTNLTITQLATQLKVKPATLRYYEDLGLINPERGSSGNRSYSPEQVDHAQRVVYFRRANVPIAKLKTLFSNKMSDELALKMLKEARVEIVHRQIELKSTLNFSDYKINYHQNKLKH